jgi:anti-sigma factor RsiW
MKKWLFKKLQKNECDKIREMLSPYIDGRLNPDRQQAVESHIQSCQACRGEYDSLLKTVDLLRHMPDVESKRSFIIKEAERRAMSGKLKALYVATIAVAVLLAFVYIGDVRHYFEVSLLPMPPGHQPADVRQYCWRIREVEFGLLGVFIILAASTFAYWRSQRNKNKSGN